MERNQNGIGVTGNEPSASACVLCPVGGWFVFLTDEEGKGSRHYVGRVERKGDRSETERSD